MYKNTKFFKTLYLVTLYSMVANIVFAQYPIVRNYNRKATNSGSQNWSIAQGKNDWMYFANNDGLLEFDGSSWSVYPIANYSTIRSTYYDASSGRMYAGAFNEFGYYQRNQQGKIIYVSLVPKLAKGIKVFNEIWGIIKHNNDIIFYTDDFIFKYGNEKVIRYVIKEKIAKIASINHFLFLATEKEGIYIFNDNFLLPLVNGSLLKHKKICSILPVQNKILFITEFDGIFQFDNKTISKMPTDIDLFLRKNQVFCADFKDGRLAIGTVRNGVVIKDINSNNNTFLNINNGLQNNTVLSISFDKQDNLWLGLDKGIDYVVYNSSISDLFGNNLKYGTGYASALIGNNLYLGTNQGLYVTKYPINNSDIGSSITPVHNIQGQIWNLALIDNNLFCGSDHGAFIIQGDNAKQIEHSVGTWAFKSFPNRADLILTSSYKGFYILKKEMGKWIVYKHLTGFDEHGMNFEIDGHSNIWFSHWIKGVFKLELNKSLDSIAKITLYDAKNGLSSSQNNRVIKYKDNIIITGENGYKLYNSNNNSLNTFSFFDNLFGKHSAASAVYFSKNSDIWRISNSAIYRAKRNTRNTFMVDSTSYSLISNKLVRGFEYINNVDTNSIIIGTEDGFSYIDLMKKPLTKEMMHNVIIEEIVLTSKKDSSVLIYNPQTSNTIQRFRSNENSMRFEFNATEYRKEDAILYKYKLEGFDENWSEYSTKKTKEYTKLKPGKYTFNVEAKNLLNNLISKTEYTFIISPAWYETIIARVLYVLFIFGCFYLFVKYMNSKSNQKIIGITELKELEIKEQKEHYLKEAEHKETEIINLKNQKLQYELRHKSQDLASSTMNIIRKNEVLQEINKNLEKMEKDIISKKDSEKVLENIKNMQTHIKKNFQYDNSWKKFQENFDLVYENYLKRLSEKYPALTVSDKKLCAYLKMNLNSKEIAPLLNMSYRSVEMSRYRLRKKLNLDRETNLTDFLQKF